MHYDALFIAVTPYLAVASKNHLPTGSFLGPILRSQLHAMLDRDPILPGVFDIPTEEGILITSVIILHDDLWGRQ